MVRIPGFHCWGLSSVPGLGSEISQVARRGQKKKKRKKKSGTETFEIRAVLNGVQDSGDGHVSQKLLSRCCAKSTIVFNLHFV